MQILDFFLALSPVLWLIIALSGLKMAGHKACLSALFLTMVLSFLYWKLSPVCILTAVLEGTLNALWPISLVIVAALFTYNLTLKTGAMGRIRSMLAGVSKDKRVLTLIIGWGFGCFMEGMAGFGTAVAIPASILAGIGLDPIGAVLSCLVANTTPTAFGSVGIPVVTLSAIADLDVLVLSGRSAVIQCVVTFLAPFLMVCISGKGIRALKGMIPTTLTAALSFVIPWFAAAVFVGPELPDIIGSIASMLCTIAAARHFNKEPDPEYTIELSESDDRQALSASEATRAWCPFLLIFVLLTATSSLCPPIQNAIAGIKSSIVVYAGENGSTLHFSWVNTPGVMIFIAGIIGGLVQGASFGDMAAVLAETMKKYWKTILTICCVISTAKIMGYSGMISDIAGLLVVMTGPLYPFIAPLIGALGGFVTGSGTSTCVLFGGLQCETAASLGMDPVWMAAANVFGAGLGKMICPQSIAIGTGAINAVGSESRILSAVFPYFLLHVIIAGFLCMAGVLLGL